MEETARLVPDQEGSNELDDTGSCYQIAALGANYLVETTTSAATTALTLPVTIMSSLLSVPSLCFFGTQNQVAKCVTIIKNEPSL